MKKPQILVLSDDNDDAFEWLTNEPNLRMRKAIIKRAALLIAQNDTVPEVCAALAKDGFEVIRSTQH